MAEPMSKGAHYARINRRMQQFLKQNPSVMQHHRIFRAEDNVYEIDGKRVRLDWQGRPGQVGRLLVMDGPLRQPLPDYLAQGETNAEYDSSGIEKTTSLHHVPKDRRMTFNDSHKRYSRLDSMKVAKEQAAFREKAANYTKEGRHVPTDLYKSYDRSVAQKLRSGRHGVLPERHEEPEPVPEHDNEEEEGEDEEDERVEKITERANALESMRGQRNPADAADAPEREAQPPPPRQASMSRSISGHALPAPPPLAPPKRQAPPHAALAIPTPARAAMSYMGAPRHHVMHGAGMHAQAQLAQKSLAAAAVAAFPAGGARGVARGGA